MNKLIKKQKGFALMTEIVTVIAAVGIIGSMALTQSNEPIIKAQAMHGLQHIYEGIVKATPANPAPINNCIVTIQNRLVRKISTMGLQSGLITQGKYSQLV